MDRLTPSRVEFIEAQPMFFVATAGASGRVNVSPKGMDTMRVVDDRRIVWLNLTGSGNETAAHVTENGRMTLMWMSIGPEPLIVRAYGTATVLHPRDARWSDEVSRFPDLAGSRQIFVLDVELVTSSCGSGVPEMTVVADRGATELEPFYAAMGEDDLHDYWQRKNSTSLDGAPTGLNGPTA